MITDSLTLLHGLFQFVQQLLSTVSRSGTIFRAAIWLPVLTLILSVFFLRRS